MSEEKKWNNIKFTKTVDDIGKRECKEKEKETRQTMV